MKRVAIALKWGKRSFCHGLLLLVLLAGCGTNQGGQVGSSAPAFSGNDIHGDFVSLSQLKGKVVVLYFWANTCCGSKLKTLEPLYRERKDRGLAIVAINSADSRETVASYAKTHQLTFTMQTDPYRVLARNYQVMGLPTIFILDRNGIIREKIRGDIPFEQLERMIEAQLADIGKKSGKGIGS